MARKLDFNALEQPTLEVVLRDENKTHITVMVPSVELVEKLEANGESITAACKRKDAHSMQVCYDLAAELMSCNEENLTITGEELRAKYGVGYGLLFAFLVAYNDFVAEIKNAKN